MDDKNDVDNNKDELVEDEVIENEKIEKDIIQENLINDDDDFENKNLENIIEQGEKIIENQNEDNNDLQEDNEYKEENRKEEKIENVEEEEDGILDDDLEIKQKEISNHESKDEINENEEEDEDKNGILDKDTENKQKETSNEDSKEEKDTNDPNDIEEKTEIEFQRIDNEIENEDINQFDMKNKYDIDKDDVERNSDEYRDNKESTMGDVINNDNYQRDNIDISDIDQEFVKTTDLNDINNEEKVNAGNINMSHVVEISVPLEKVDTQEDSNDIEDENNNTNTPKILKIKESILPSDFDYLPESHQNRKPVSALTPVFSFGYNRHVPIINLSTDKRCFIFYSASHLAIVYDYFHNEQMILQGHCNSITCTSASKDKRWLASGDKGENSVVIIWDCNTGLPVRSMFEPHPMGVVSIALTPDARYLATLSAENAQTFAIWDWTTGEDIPLCSATLGIDYGTQVYIAFNEEDIFHVATNSDSRVLFYQWDKIGNIKYFAPKLTDKDFNKQVGKFSNTVYIPKTTKAITATSQGLLVVWECNTPLLKVSNISTPDKKAVKLVPVHAKGINVLTLIDSYIVTGDIGGDIKFFDFNFMLIFWYKDWNFGSITSISASNAYKIDKFRQALESSDYPGDATIENNKFYLRDFIVGTYNTIFATIGVEGSKVKIIFHEHDQAVFSVAAHPTLPLVATGSYSGLLKIWDYEQKQSLKTRLFDKVPIKCLCFDHRGVQLAIGFTNGEVRILDTHGLKDVTKTPFRFSKVHITHILFSEHSEFLATVDANSTTTVFRPRKDNLEDTWVYLARYRAHYKPVVDLMFGRFFDTEVPRLFTLGADRRLVEYDLGNATEDNLPIAHEIRIEQRAVPSSMCWYPEENKEGFLVTANDEYKLKMYNHRTKMCRFTYLGPTFGSPVKILKTLPAGSTHPRIEDGNHQRYVAYANQNKVGLIRLAFDGNPYNYMTMIAHPKGVTNMCCSFDGNYLISVGEDFIVTVWKTSVDILETQARLGGTDMSPYYELIEGGEFGKFMNELKDYFYYSMIRTQGIDSLQTRKVDVVIEISEVPYIMRGIGFYPSEEEIEDMLNQLKFKDYYLTGECATKVDLDTFLKLYINHRPAFGIPSMKIDDAFRNILRNNNGDLSIDQFMDMLINKGENILEDDLAEYLATLLGFNPLGGSLEMEDFDPTKVMNAVNESLPKIVTSENFIEDILCMKIVEKESTGTKKNCSNNVIASGTQT